MKKQGVQGPVIHWEADVTRGEAAVLLPHLDPGMDSISLAWHRRVSVSTHSYVLNLTRMSLDPSEYLPKINLLPKYEKVSWGEGTGWPSLEPFLS